MLVENKWVSWRMYCANDAFETTKASSHNLFLNFIRVDHDAGIDFCILKKSENQNCWTTQLKAVGLQMLQSLNLHLKQRLLNINAEIAFETVLLLVLNASILSSVTEMALWTMFGWSEECLTLQLHCDFCEGEKNAADRQRLSHMQNGWRTVRDRRQCFISVANAPADPGSQIWIVSWRKRTLLL